MVVLSTTPVAGQLGWQARASCGQGPCCRGSVLDMPQELLRGVILWYGCSEALGFCLPSVGKALYCRRILLLRLAEDVFRGMLSVSLVVRLDPGALH